MEKISLIIPCYNVQDYVKRCLESIENQTIGMSMMEIILVDDASADGTLSLLAEFEKKYPENVLVIACEKNGKLGTARNIGLDYASGDYIMFVDSDDVLDVTMLEKMYAKIKEYDCEVVECDYKVFSQESELFAEQTGEDFYLEIDKPEKRKKIILRALKTAVWSRLYKKEFLEKNALRFLEQIYYEDVHFSGLTMLLHQNYYYIGETLYYYYQNENGIIRSKGNADKIKGELEVRRILFEDLKNRGIFDEVMKNYHDELEYYVVYKSYFDALNYVFVHQLPKWRELVEYFKEGVLSVFPNGGANIYMKDVMAPQWEMYRKFLEGKESRTEQAFRNRREKVIVLMNTQEHMNSGEHLIAVATRNLLRDYYPDYQIIEITAQHYSEEKVIVGYFLRPEDIIVIAGGGCLGSVWLYNGEWNVRSIIRNFPAQKIIVFPQTMYYENNEKGCRELIQTLECYQGHKHLTICLRDKRSYIFAKMMLPEQVSCKMYPDSALYWKYDKAEKKERNGCALCFWNEGEGTLTRGELETVVRKVVEKDYELFETSMVLKEFCEIEERETMVETKAEEFAGYELVLTNRLHCMIYCAITKTPCVAFQNLTGEVGGVYEWMKELPYIRVIEDIQQIDEVMEEVVTCEKKTVPISLLKNQFEQLAAEVCEVDMLAVKEV